MEDNKVLAKGIAYRMEDAGHSVDVFHDGAEADAFLQSDRGDIGILDINLPSIDGLSLLKNMRARGDERPVIMLTARSDLDTRIKGLDSGADDYLIKPFEMSELEARIRALARRGKTAMRQHITFGPLKFDVGARQVELDGNPVVVPRREISVLEALLNSQGRTVSKAELLDYTYGVGADVEESVVEVHISRLRKRLKGTGVTITVQRGLGYALQEVGE